MTAAGVTTEDDEQSLLAGLRQRQAVAYERLMRRYNRLLFRSVRGIVSDEAQAQDVLQETYLRAFLNLETFRGDSSLGTWLVRIAIHQALTHQRRQGRLVLWGEGPREEVAMNDPHDPTPVHAFAPASSAEEEAARRQLNARLEAAIDQLAPIYRSVFILRAVEGLSVEETAHALLVSRDVVKTRYLRARALMRARLQSESLPEAGGAYAFAGSRCDATVAHVLARLRAAGVLRDH